ncbi:hypothetical protein GW17_00038652 [Ensete ventricosum]|nr:hypothetical protein GW17_00038652 [Ensete ventricosum]RZS11380.1 hypothetical protein BHM03_00042700 [Ensete ventricosum]
MLSLQFRGDDGISFSRSMAKGYDGGWAREKRRRAPGLLYSWWEEFGCLFPSSRKEPGRFCLSLFGGSGHAWNEADTDPTPCHGGPVQRTGTVGSRGSHNWFPGSNVTIRL